MKIAIIILSSLKQYRYPLFEKMIPLLLQKGIYLKILYGIPNDTERLKGDDIFPESMHYIKVKNTWLLNGSVLFQSTFKYLNNADLVIIEQAVKYINYFVYLLNKRFGIPYKLAFWGHGYNRQGNINSIPEKIKKNTLKYSDWFFAYTQSTVDYLKNNNFPISNITLLNNSIDVKKNQEILKNEGDSFSLPSDLYFTSQTCIYVGSLYPLKMIDFLLKSAKKIKSICPEFNLIIIGDGPDRNIVENFRLQNDWIQFLGASFGNDKIVIMSKCQLFLNPGLVGLSILDAFSIGLPIITTSVPFHSPEIDYLIHGYNGLMIENDPSIYANSTADLLNNPDRLMFFKQNALNSVRDYSIEKMAENFVNGIEKCLDSKNES